MYRCHNAFFQLVCKNIIIITHTCCLGLWSLMIKLSICAKVFVFRCYDSSRTHLEIACVQIQYVDAKIPFIYLPTLMDLFIGNLVHLGNE